MSRRFRPGCLTRESDHETIAAGADGACLVKLARRSALLVVALFACSLFLLACPGPVAEIDATVKCTGDACGKTGDLHIWVEPCGGGTVADSKDLTNVALDPTAPFVVKFKNISGTDNCV